PGQSPPDLPRVSALRDLRELVPRLEQCGRLRRVSVPVTGDLEITEITDRVSKGPAAQNVALLFERVEGFDMPVLVNAFGAADRLALALGVGHLDELGERVAKLLDVKLPGTFAERLRKLGTLFDLVKAGPRRVTDAPCQEVVETERASLASLPVLRCWPKDGGSYITLPCVFTRDPKTGTRNVGMYRLQVFDDRTLGMHWQTHKGGAEHERVMTDATEPRRTHGTPPTEGPGSGDPAPTDRMPVAIALGGDHALRTADLPDDDRRSAAGGGLLARQGDRAPVRAHHPAPAARGRRRQHAGRGYLPQPRDRVDPEALPGPRAQGDDGALGHGPHDAGEDDRRRQRARERPRSLGGRLARHRQHRSQAGPRDPRRADGRPRPRRAPPPVRRQARGRRDREGRARRHRAAVARGDRHVGRDPRARHPALEGLRALNRLARVLDAIKFEHTVFALPFAYIAMVLAAGGWPGGWTVGWATAAMVGARTCAMATNRVVDRHIDARNPRTATRHLPTGALRVGELKLLAAVGAALLLVAAAMLNPLCVALAPLALVFLVGYSYTKRFTWTSHWILGFTDGLAAAGGWIAVRGAFEAPAFLLWF